MAYPYLMTEVRMAPNSVSTAGAEALATVPAAIPPGQLISLGVGAVTYTPTGNGAGVWGPMIMPHKIHRIGVKMSANLANPADLIFWKKIEGGATGWVTGAPLFNPTGEFFRFTVPTTAATGKVIYKNVTGTYIVYPGELLCVGVSTVISSALVQIGLGVSPVWEQPANVTSMSQTTAP